MENVILLLTALVITILVEIAVLLLMGEKRRKVIIASAVINIITNVPLNIVMQHVGISVPSVVIGETVVVIVEALWYCLFVGKVSQAAVYSVLCNAISFLTGVIIFGIDNNLT